MVNMQLSESQKKYLRRLAHSKKAVVLIGNNGLNDAVMSAIDQALNDHELIKIKIRLGDRDLRDQALVSISDTLDTFVVQRIGNTATLYRPHPEKPRLSLPRRGG